MPTHSALSGPGADVGATVLTVNSISLFPGQLLLIGPAGPSRESLTIANSDPARTRSRSRPWLRPMQSALRCSRCVRPGCRP